MLAALWLVVPGALRAQPAAASTTVTAATAGLAVGWSSEQCAAPSSSSDADADGLDDRCEHALAEAFAPAQNAGSRHRPFGGHTGPEGCVGASVTGPGSPRLDRDAVECVWSVSRPFHGWQLAPAGDPPTPYGRHLRDYANF